VTPVFGKGIVFDSPINLMYEQIKFIKSALVVNQLKKHASIIENEARSFFEREWSNSGEVDMLDNMNRLTILTASRCLLGREIRSNPKVAGEFARLYHDLEGGLNPIAFFFPNAPIKAHKIRDRARAEIAELFGKFIKQRRQMPPGEEKPDDMLQILIESEYKGGIPLDDATIIGMMIGTLFAGQHTSGITSSWTGFYLLKHRNFYNELIEEQKEIISQFGQEVSFDSLKASMKLENAIREALRMFPPLIILMRKAKKDIQYKDYVIPAGDFVCVAPAFAMRLPDVFEDPNTYNPHRYDQKGEDKQIPYSYIAFGGGRHGCPGENFALVQVKTIWTLLLRNYDLDFGNQGFPMPDYTNLVVGPTQPCLVKYKKRDVPL